MNTPEIAHKRQLVTGDLLLLILLLAGCIAYRLMGAEIIEDGGDALGHWSRHRYASLLDYFRLPYYDHHRARFSVEIPINLVLTFTGPGAAYYYAPPLVFAILQVWFIYLVGLRQKYFLFPVLAAVTAILYPQMIRAGAQNLPGVFSSVYMIATAYFLLRFQEKNYSRFYLLVALFCFFLAYGSKITCVFFFPGLVIALFFMRKDWRDPLLAIVFFGGFVFLEWLTFFLTAGLPYGRLSAISGHMSKELTEGYEFWELFDRYSLKTVPAYIAYTLWAAMAISAYFIVRDFRTMTSRKILGLLYLSFVIFSIFGIKSIDPLLPAERFLPRYLTVLTPFAVLLVSHFIFELYAGFIRAGTFLLRREFSLYRGVGLLLVLCTFTFIWYHYHQSNIRNRSSYLSGKPLAPRALARYEAASLKALELGIPLYFKDLKSCITFSRLYKDDFYWTCRLAAGRNDKFFVLRAPEYKVEFVQKQNFTKHFEPIAGAEIETDARYVDKDSILWIARPPFQVVAGKLSNEFVEDFEPYMKEKE